MTARAPLAALAAVCLALLLAPTARGAEPVALDQPQPPLNLHAKSTYHADRSGELTIAGARAIAAAGGFTPFDLGALLLDLTDPVHWVRVALENASGAPGRWYLDLNLKAVPLGEIWLVRESAAPERVLRVDASTSFEARPLDLRSLAVPIDLAAGERVEVYLRFLLNTDIEYELTVQGADRMLIDLDAETAKYFLYAGFILCIALVAFAISLTLLDRSAFFYGLYVSTLLLWAFYMDGLAFQYLWPDWPWLNETIMRPINAMIALTGALFGRTFFDLPNNHPGLDRLYRAVMIGVAVMGLSVLVSDHRVLTGLGFLFIALLAQIYLATGIVAVRRGWAGSAFFLVGSLSVALASLAAIVVHAMPGAGLLEASRDWGRVAFVIEAIAFLCAIGTRIVRIRRERAEASARAFEALERQLALSEDLRRADENHRRAMALAERRRAAMAYATHDLRQPLVALRHAVHGLRALPTREREALREHCDTLESLVEGYLDEATEEEVAAEAESCGAAAPSGTKERFSASLLLDAVGSMYREEAAQKGLALRVAPSTVELSADPMASIRALTNFAANAIAYTETGGVLIGCRRRTDGLLVAVYDTGPGLTPEALEAVRRPGVSGPGSTGKGLGLASVDEIARTHGLGVVVHSRPGRGSCFGILLPYADADAVPQRAAGVMPA